MTLRTRCQRSELSPICCHLQRLCVVPPDCLPRPLDTGAGGHGRNQADTELLKLLRLALLLLEVSQRNMPILLHYANAPADQQMH